jgi:hypothetical protein
MNAHLQPARRIDVERGRGHLVTVSCAKPRTVRLPALVL